MELTSRYEKGKNVCMCACVCLRRKNNSTRTPDTVVDWVGVQDMNYHGASAPISPATLIFASAPSAPPVLLIISLGFGSKGAYLASLLH